MAQHLIPEGEEDKHIELPECECDPEFRMDEDSGEMIWVHKHLELKKKFAGFFKM